MKSRAPRRRAFCSFYYICFVNRNLHQIILESMMKKMIARMIVVLAAIVLSMTASSQEKREKPSMSEETFEGLKLRGIGPALMAGRIADIAIHPGDNSTWYVAVGSGGVWKTVNAGTTWESIFDGQGSYSTGCVTVDPRHPNVIWTGTGENVGGRHVAFGDGVYRSDDAGKSWKNMGLKDSRHISKILVHPGNSDIIWVAAQGPLWDKGGERGLYKSTDGGKTWRKTLGGNEWTGVTEVVLDPRDPDRLYAATWQRHRSVAAYIGGGPGSGIHRSTDGGETWEELEKGLPSSNMGKIGLALSPQQPDVLYAAIELDRRTGGVYKSTDRGSTWQKQSSAVSGATGPHYYQELYASPHAFDRIYLVDVRTQVSDDGGKTFRRMKEQHKHSDNHAIAFRHDDPDYLLVGTDGGLYETFDLAETWRFIANMPITQFYKIAVDDDYPFYNVYGGTQDNNSQGGPSRTANSNGIRNADWFITLFADGHGQATEPGNPDIVYSEWQEGNLVRYDRTTNEIVYIQPQPGAGEEPERFNWDAPILVSPHSATRLYFASQRVWRSDDRGDSWTAISGDLTRDQERITLPIMETTWSIDSPWDFEAMSMYNTITSLAESPLKEGLIYAGTDDGIIQVTDDGGENWRKIEVDDLPGVPKTAFVNDIKADLFDVNTVYVALDNHKFGDLKPYLLKSTDRGKSWRSITGNIPERTLVWRIVQDHVKKDLLFAGTEFGVCFTVDGGEKWIMLTGNAPTISFRDLVIQRRENDLVCATFGRSFYILDDYAPLREVSEEKLKEEGSLYQVRDTYWYLERPLLGQEGKASQGAAYFTAPNPPFGAVFTYHLAEGLKTKKEERRESEKEKMKNEEGVPFPGWEALEKERMQQQPKVWLTVKDEEGNLVRRVEGPVSKGFHRVAWDLRYPLQTAIDIHRTPRYEEWEDVPSGKLAAPGKYTVTLAKEIDGVITELAGPVEFNVVRMREGALEGAGPEELVAFRTEIEDLEEAVSAASIILRNAIKKTDAMQVALTRATSATGTLDKQLHDFKMELNELKLRFQGSRIKAELGKLNTPTIHQRLRVASMGTQNSTYGPTPTHRESLKIAREQFAKFRVDLEKLVNEKMPELEMALRATGAPWIEGQPVPEY